MEKRVKKKGAYEEPGGRATGEKCKRCRLAIDEAEPGALN